MNISICFVKSFARTLMAIWALLALSMNSLAESLDSEETEKSKSVESQNLENPVVTDSGVENSIVKPTQDLTAEIEPNPKRRVAGPVMIESRVKGSQEQPNVIYIMPWQGVNDVVAVDEKNLTLVLPEFQPINPIKFKQQVQQFSQLQTVNSSEAVEQNNESNSKSNLD